MANHLRRKWLISYERMQAVPVYLPPECMRQLWMRLLREYTKGELPGDFYLPNVIVQRHGDGDGVFTLDTLGAPSFCVEWVEQSALKHRRLASSSFSIWGLKGFIDALIGHASQYCQDTVVDWNGTYVAKEDRYVLDPVVLAREVDNLNHWGNISPATVEDLLRNVPPESLVPGSWRNRNGVVRWQTKLNGWCKRGEQPYLSSASAVRVDCNPQESLCLPLRNCRRASL